MKRLTRWLFNLAAVVSLILCVVFASAWIRSYWRSDRLFYWLQSSSANTTVHLKLSRGEFAFSQTGRPGGLLYIEERTPHRLDWRTENGGDFTSMHPDGWFRFNRYTPAEVDVGRPHYSLFTRLPCWLLVTTASIGFLCSYLVIRKRRPITGRCSVCGYDLRATPQRCPEGGAIPLAAEARRT